MRALSIGPYKANPTQKSILYFIKFVTVLLETLDKPKSRFSRVSFGWRVG